MGDGGVEIGLLGGLLDSSSAPEKGVSAFGSVWKGDGILKMALGGSSVGSDSWTGGGGRGVEAGEEMELASVTVLLGQKLNLGGLSNGLELLGFGVAGFNVADESPGCETEISGVGAPNMPTFANGFKDGVPTKVGGKTNGWAVGSRPTVFLVDSCFDLDFSACWVSLFFFFVSSSE